MQRRCEGLVPDFLAVVPEPPRPPADASDELMELKTLHYGSTTYPSEGQGRCAAVARRTRALPNEDHPSTRAKTGPFQQGLRRRSTRANEDHDSSTAEAKTGPFQHNRLVFDTIAVSFCQPSPFIWSLKEFCSK